MNVVQDSNPVTQFYSLLNPPAKDEQKSGVQAAQDRFLTLLVTQMRNQDPLNPLDNAQITTQLAQISTVSGIEKLNTTLQALSTSFGTNQAIQAATMVGHDVLVPGSTLALVDGAASAGLELQAAAEKVLVTIRDAAGKALHSVDLGAHPAGFIGLQWDGVTDSGATAADGVYSFSVAALNGDKKVAASTLGVGRVDSVIPSGQSVLLNVTGVGQIELSQVKQIF